MSGAGNVTLGSKALTVGGLNTSTTISGVISDSGSLTKTGTGTLTRTNTYTGGTTISAGILVARGTALGTGAVSVASGATLAVGQAANTTQSAIATGAQSLSISSLTVAASAGNTTPFLTFNLFDGGVSDMLTLTGTGTTLSFSSAGGSKFIVAFASGAGSDLTTGTTYNLINFANSSASSTFGFDTTNANNSFSARGTGNLDTTGMFQWAKSGNNITGLQYVVISGSEVPEPGSLVLLLTGLTSFTAVAIRARQKGKSETR